MRLSFFAFDLGPAKNLARIARLAIDRAHRVAFVGNDELGLKNFLKPLPDIVLTSLSSKQPGIEAELNLIEAASTLKVPTVVMADTHGTFGRPAARGRINQAIVLVAAPGELEEARTFGYARAVYLGGPPLWQEYATIEGLPAPRVPGERVVLVGGIKKPELTDRLLEAVVTACREVFGEDWWLIFRPHPNEDPIDAERRAKILEGVKILDVKASSTGLLPSVDLSVFTSGATDTIAGAYRRVPTIYYEDEAVRARLTELIGRPDWFPAESGASLKAEGVEGLKQAFRQLSTPEGLAALRSRQEEVYPPIPAGTSVEANILDFLSTLLAPR